MLVFLLLFPVLYAATDIEPEAARLTFSDASVVPLAENVFATETSPEADSKASQSATSQSVTSQSVTSPSGMPSAGMLPESVASKHEFTKRIANPKVLFLKTMPPPTRIDLAGVYESHPGFEGCEPHSEIVVKSDEKIVRSKLDGRTLVLEWCGIGKTKVILRTVNPVTGFVVDESVELEVASPNFFLMFCTLLGGLGIFLLGMKNMSEGFQMIAGERLRRMIALLTDNRFAAVGVGVITTVLIQSSSVTTVMVVGFVNSQIMALSQGIGVIMGANIGTTFIAWILTMNIKPVILPLIGISACFFLFGKGERPRSFAMAGLGVGFIFYGMQLMQDGFSGMSELPSFIECMEMFSARTYSGVLLCALTGCVMTMIVQASAATVGITISLASIGLIDFNTAAALVLGENVGTTITAMLASIGMSTNARRAAYFHVAFNTIGVLWVSALFLPLDFPGIVAWVVGIDPVTGEIMNSRIGLGIALTHSLFNITNMIVFLPFVHTAADLLIRFVPDDGESGPTTRLTGLNVRLLETAAISIEQSRIEVQRMGNCCRDLAATVKTIIESDGEDQEAVRKHSDRAFQQEEMLDTLQDEIIAFTSGLLSGNISHDVADITRNQLKMADEIESIGDYLVIILKSNLKLHDSGLVIPEAEKAEILDLHRQTIAYLGSIFLHYAQRRPGPEVLPLEHSQGKTINAVAKSIRDRFIKRMSEDRFDPQIIIALNTQLNAYRRIREHGRNVAEAIGGVR